MRNRSIRFRLTIWYSLALTVGLIIFGLATWLSMSQSLFHDLNRSLADRVQSAQAFVIAELNDPKVHLAEEIDEYSHGLPSGNYLQVKNEDGTVLFTSDSRFPWPATVRGHEERAHRLNWNGHSYLMLSNTRLIQGRPWEFAISTPLDEADRLLARLRLFLLTLLPSVIAAALIGGTWLSRRALRPVDQLTAAARTISLENLSERLPVPQTGDELARLAETWNFMLSRLEQTMGRLSRFTADASHELRTPLAVIRTTAELAVRRDRSSESYCEALLRVVGESERMTALLDDLLLLARVDSESVEFPRSPVDLAALTRQVCSQVQPLAERKALHLKFQSSPERLEILVNEAAIRRLVLVLLDNAVKYSKSGGEITVALHQGSDTLNLEVSDCGPGIQREELAHIFERFYRSPQTQQATTEGSGLGLSLAAAIAQKHNALIRVTRSSEQGSTFSVLFENGA